MSTTEIFVVPCLVRRLVAPTVSPPVIVRIIMGVVPGPGVLGAAFPGYHRFVFNPDVVKTLNGIAQWGVMLFATLAAPARSAPAGPDCRCSRPSPALPLMAVGSTMLTVPVVHPELHRARYPGLVNQASS